MRILIWIEVVMAVLAQLVNLHSIPVWLHYIHILAVRIFVLCFMVLIQTIYGLVI